MNANYEVKFNTVKKDKDGFVPLLVRCGEYCVPMLGMPLALTQYDRDALDAAEIKRLNLSRWILKDIPEVASVFCSLSPEGWCALMYFNGREGSWKFYERNPFSIDDEADGFDDKLDALDEVIESLDSELYKPHYDESGNTGDESVHAVYTNDLSRVRGGCISVKDYDSSYDPEDPTGDELDLVSFIMNIPAKIGLARKQHKALPYGDIGQELVDMICAIDDDGGNEAVGKLFYRLVKRLRGNA